MPIDCGSACFQTLLLSILVIQNSSSVLVGRFTRSSTPADQRYDVAHMIILTELMKLILSAIMECFLNGRSSVLSAFSYKTSLQLIPPALLYLIQNSLVFISLAYLTIPTFQVLSQTKLILTALLSTLFLNHTYKARQWGGLVLLTSGVTIITVSEGRNDSGTDQGKHSDTALGVSLVLLSSMCSSLAGIYFEALIKNITTAWSCTFCCCYDNDWNYQRLEANLTVASVWVRNIQLSTITLLISMAKELFSHVLSMKDVTVKPHRGFFAGFTPWVYVQILLLGGGGLTVAAVIKYTDNVRKGIATGISVVVSSLLSAVVFRSALPTFFVTGISLVLLGLILFNDDLSNVFLRQKRIYGRILVGMILIKVFSLYSQFILPSMSEVSFFSLSSLESSRNSQSLWNHSADQRLWNPSGIPP
jgi:UDP-sugar transporter A1/2/3